MLNDRPIGSRCFNTRQVAEFRGGSVPSLRRAIREGRYAKPDFYRGPYAYWTEETARAERDREIRESAARSASRYAAQRDSAERAREVRRRKLAKCSTNTPDTAA
jgi:hypothetical protein